MKPAINRIVLYVLSQKDCDLINTRRAKGDIFANAPYVGDILPLIICRVWPPELYDGKDSINGQVMLDGNGSHWVTSVHPCADKTPGSWHWPEIAPKSGGDSISRMDAELSLPREVAMVDGLPRRIRTDLHSPAEIAISRAMAAVEEAGAHPLLTNAVVLLGAARDKVADFVELPAQQAPIQSS